MFKKKVKINKKILIAAKKKEIIVNVVNTSSKTLNPKS